MSNRKYATESLRGLGSEELLDRFLESANLEFESTFKDSQKFMNDPLGFVRSIFPWGKGALEGEDGPDEWQAQFLHDLGEATRDAKGTVQFATSSGHGVGKTALVAWIILWFLSTRPHPQVVTTANTNTQLTTKTWRELSKWHKLANNGGLFEWTATKFYLKLHPETWFASAIPWSAENSEAFAGTHEKHVLIIFDESSAIDDRIWEVASGAMTSPGAVWLVFGNPTRNNGRFKECFPGGKFAHRWITRTIDSRTAKKADKAQIEKWIADYGLDSDFVRIRALGEFPRASSNQFISEDLVTAAMARNYQSQFYDFAPLVFGVDVARYGDDKSVILIRQGMRVEEIKKFRELDLMKLVGLITENIKKYNPQNVFVDVVGIGAGVVDRLRQLGYREVIEVNSGEKAIAEKDYMNLRAEMWGKMRDWLKTAQLPPDEELKADLIGPEYGFDSKNRIQLERKADMKSRGLASPDIADALAMTFAVDVAPIAGDQRRQIKAETVFNVLEEHDDRDPIRDYRETNIVSDFDPFR